MISTLQLSWKHNYTWHHTHYMWHQSHCICPATPGASIDHNSLGSYPTWHTYDIIHTLHDITITLYDITPFIGMTAHPLYVQYHKTYIRHHTHILLFYEIKPHFVWHHMHCFLKSLPLYLTLHPIYLCHQDQCINYTTTTLCMTAHNSMYDITVGMHDITWTHYDITPV